MGENVCIEILDAIYEDMKSLTNMDVTNTMRCGQHIKNYALQMYWKYITGGCKKIFFLNMLTYITYTYVNVCYVLHISFFPSFIIHIWTYI